LPSSTDFGHVLTEILQLKDQSLFIEKAYINGEWVDAKSGETFEVHGKYLISPIFV
jgi:hypothetical protein